MEAGTEWACLNTLYYEIDGACGVGEEHDMN